MNYERDTLTRSLEELRSKIAEASQAAYDQEMLVTKSMDRFEQLLSDYTSLGHQIGTILPLHDGGLGAGKIDYTIELELGLEDVSAVQTAGRKMRGTIRPGLQSYGDTFRKQLSELAHMQIQLDDEFDRLGQSVERQKEEASNLEMRLRVVHEQADDARNVSRNTGAMRPHLIAAIASGDIRDEQTGLRA